MPIDYSESIRIGKAFINLKCSRCGSLIPKKVYDSDIKYNNDNVYCSKKCACIVNGNIEKINDLLNYDIDLSDYKRKSPKHCQEYLGVLDCTECITRKCIYDLSTSDNNSNQIRILLEQYKENQLVSK